MNASQLVEKWYIGRKHIMVISEPDMKRLEAMFQDVWDISATTTLQLEHRGHENVPPNTWIPDFDIIDTYTETLPSEEK